MCFIAARKSAPGGPGWRIYASIALIVFDLVGCFLSEWRISANIFIDRVMMGVQRLGDFAVADRLRLDGSAWNCLAPPGARGLPPAVANGEAGSMMTADDGEATIREPD